MLQQVLSSLTGKPAKERLDPRCVSYMSGHSVSQAMIETFEECAYAGPIRIGRLWLSRLADLEQENEEEENAPCIRHGFLIIGTGLNGDPMRSKSLPGPWCSSRTTLSERRSSRISRSASCARLSGSTNSGHKPRSVRISLWTPTRPKLSGIRQRKTASTVQSSVKQRRNGMYTAPKDAELSAEPVPFGGSLRWRK